MSRVPSSSDRDSLAALDALLKLNATQEQQQQALESALGSHRAFLHQQLHNNSNNMDRSHDRNRSDSLGSLHRHASQGLQGFRSPYSSAAQSLANSMSLPSSLLNSAGMFLQSPAAKHHFSASQLAAAQAAASLVPPPSSPATSLSQQLHAVEQAAAMQKAAAAAASFSNNSIAATAEGGAKSSSSNSLSNEGASESIDETTPTIRPEKVEAALRSKPQRGKRRDDLSEKERIELTRTRNREHAKSTRMRKKARYQELLDSEDQLKAMKELESLRLERLESYQKFLTIRETMLNTVHLENTSGSTMAPPPATSHLQELVDHLGTFQYEIHDHKYGGDEVALAAKSEHRQISVSRMRSWDRFILDQILESDSVDSEPVTSSFLYEVVDGVDGIAISSNGTGFARVDLIQTLKPSNQNGSLPFQKRTILSGVLQVHFAATSNRLSSACWTSVQHMPSSSQRKSSGGSVELVPPAAAAAPPRDDPSSSSNDSLEYQMVHPSVVSLDPKTPPVDAAESHGPGMAI
mmetsp:Transcript_17192/g.30935  ORF Transcript_17192/g.30935 Transcript_17192/m.30935 type:complete len:521 (+) Transcript_17192:894-2456(+)